MEDNDRQRDKGGKFAEEVTLDSVKGVFEEAEIPVLTSNDVAERLDCSRATAYNKLESLTDEGELIKKKAGAKSSVYILWND
jgi:Fic family protein